MPAPTGHDNFPIVVLASGEGTNVQAILDGYAAGVLAVSVQAVISDRPHARALTRAHSAGVATAAALADDYPDRERYDAALLKIIERYKPGLVVLAGFMRILSDDFVHHYRGRLMNIHPSLLPKYPGLHTHRRALDAGEQEHGCSVHFVTQTLDGGPVIAQAKVMVLPSDTVNSLRMRVQHEEHRLYPQIINWFASGRLQLKDEQVILDGKYLQRPILLPAQEHGLR